MKYNILFVVLLGVASVVYGQEIINENVNATTVNGTTVISPVYDSLGKLIGNLVEATTETVDGVITISGTVVDSVSGEFIGFLNITGGTVGKIVDDAGQTIETGVTVATDFLNSIMSGLGHLANSTLSELDGALNETFGALGGAINKTVDKVTGVVNGTVGTVTSIVNGTANLIYTAGTTVTGLVGGATTAVTNIVTGILGSFGSLFKG